MQILCIHNMFFTYLLSKVTFTSGDSLLILILYHFKETIIVVKLDFVTEGQFSFNLFTTNWKFIFNLLDGLLTIKSHDPLNTWSCQII